MGGRTGELILLLLVFILLFGAQKLPEIGAALGKAIREFKKAMQGELSSNDDAKKN